MKLILKALAFVGLVALAGTAMAEYNPDDDVYIKVENETATKLAKTLKLGDLGDDLFDAQEGAHEVVGETTGEEVDHYYIHVCVGDECVPVDPVRFRN